MTDLRKAAEQALEALESAANNEGNFHDYKYAANALRQALDHVPEPDMGIDRGAWDDVPDATKWVDELRGGDETEQPYKEFANRMYRETDGRMRINPVTGDVGIGSPSEQPEQEPVTWRNAAIRLGEDLYSVGPNGYYDMTASQWLDWALSVVNTAPPKPAQDLIVGYADSHDIARDGHDFWVSRQPGKNTVPLYLYGHPPKIWQGLTDEERYLNDCRSEEDIEYARAIEVKLREKNT